MFQGDICVAERQSSVLWMLSCDAAGDECFEVNRPELKHSKGLICICRRPFFALECTVCVAPYLVIDSVLYISNHAC